MDKEVLFPILTGVIAVLDATAILSARFYHEYKKKWILALSLAAFAISGYIYVLLLEFAVTAIINIIYIGFSTITVTMVCFFAFKERITLGQAVGIGLIVFGINLL